jgi:tRNA threonylcarbamoyl adenosine modification protein YeaZ
MRILALNGASAAAGIGFGLLTAENDSLRTESETLLPGRDGAGLPLLLQHALFRTGWSPASLALIAVVIGPGSFTGLRASLALAHGLALGSQALVVGVTVGEALAPVLREAGGTDEIWCVSQARRGRVFIERPLTGLPVLAAMLDALPVPSGPVLLGGDASAAVAEALDAPGSVRLSGLSAPTAAMVASAALARRAAALPPRTAQPLYVDPPEARLPQAGRTA